ncbi:MAG TPA: hypothetical protein VFX06_10710 [Stellaceae bacterium]|nr:hypothetical protein [Stellaceae bacterium]
MTNATDRNDIERAAFWLAAWDAQGLHRTGGDGDRAGAEWLAGEARALGAEVEIEPFALDRLDPVAAFLELGGERIEGVPVFDAPATGADGVTGRLGGEIAVAELSPRAVYSGEFEALRRAGQASGLVVVCAGDNPGLGLLNAEQFRTPYGSPAIHVSSEARDRVMAALAAGAPGRLVSESRRSRAEACNIIARIAGPADGAGGAPLVVMTPRSSWWQSTAERGGGIVCWLESLRALIARPPRRPVVFTANSGHELGHLGLDEFIARRPGWDGPPAEDGATWVHYGANIGAAGGTLSLVSPVEELRTLAAAELTHAGQAYTAAPATLVPSGETRDIHKAGGHYLTLVGTNPLFHLPQDRWPGSVDLAAIVRIAAAASRIVRQLAGP